VILKVPLFLVLGWGVYYSGKAGWVLFTALVRASGAVFGAGGGFLAAVIGWIPTLLPLFLYYSLLKNIPGTWLRRDDNMTTAGRLGWTVGILVLFIVLAELTFIGDAKLVAFIADRNPCAAFRAGVTGDVPLPRDCR
jgi:hypothetical protein